MNERPDPLQRSKCSLYAKSVCLGSGNCCLPVGISQETSYEVRKTVTCYTIVLNFVHLDCPDTRSAAGLLLL